MTTLWFAVFALILSGVAPVCIAYASSSDLTPLRVFSTHPWTIYWAALFLFLPFALLVNILPDRVLAIIGFAFVALWIVWALGAIQGLRKTWKRSRGIAIAIII